MSPVSTMFDIVYPVRPGDVNEELRYSLRSLDVNYPNHGTVWIVGFQPSWLTNVKFIEGNASSNGHANVYQNVLAACRHSGVSENAIIFNDDFFVTEPVTDIPLAYRGTLAEHLNLPRLKATNAKSWWKDSLLTTQVCLQALGFEDPLSYELHIPMPVNTRLMRETLERFNDVTPHNPPQWRTLYGNLHVDPNAAVRMGDGKAFRPGQIRRPYLSTTDLSWRHFRPGLSTMFPTPSRYELPPVPQRRPNPSVHLRTAMAR